ncbi:MAG: hypothetical protein JXA23_00995 [Bacteroidales bacterium]|nr:hypothetical protein [Bacteroidales bacterium]
MVLVIFAGIGLLSAWLYYRYENAAEDPRVKGARLLLEQYDELIQDGKFDEGLILLDSIEQIYVHTPCYSESFEMGVIHNNRGSAWLSIALYHTSDSVRKAEFLVLARKEICLSIDCYEGWLQRFDTMTIPEIKKEVKQCFPLQDPELGEIDYQRVVDRRVEDLELAKIETPRRLSVSYSNLGIIQRHQYEQDSAIQSYIKALKLWNRNPSAKNNLNTLLGREAQDESILKQLFPPDRRKPEN